MQVQTESIQSKIQEAKIKNNGSSSGSKTPVSQQNKKTLNHSNSSSNTPIKQFNKGSMKGASHFSTVTNDYAQLIKQCKEQELELSQLRCQQKAQINRENVINDLQEEIQELRDKFFNSEQKRIELQDKIISSSNIQQDCKLKLDNFKEMVLKENEELKLTLAKKDKEQREKDSRIDYLRNIINEGELEKQQMKLVIDENLTKSKGHEDGIYESEQKRILLQNEYSRSLDDYNYKLKTQYQIIEKLTKEIEDLKERIREAEKENGILKIEKSQIENLFKQEQDKTKKMNELNKILNDVKQERDLLMKQLELFNQEKQFLLDKLAKLRDETQQLLQKVRDDMKQIYDANKNLERQLFEKDEDLVKKDNIIKNLTQKQLELGEAMNKFQRFLDAHNDLKRQIEDIKKENDILRQAKSKAHKDLLESNKLLDEAAMGTDQYNSKVQALLDRIKEQDEEIEAMKLYVQQMRAKYQIYLPDKDDPIDSYLAEYINNYPERSKLRIMFLKECEGVYHFGSRRVYVRVERDKISVRVGGGYLSIDEFLDIYTPMELERVERNDPIKKFSEKVAVQKTLKYHSPIRSPINQKTESFIESENGSKKMRVTSPNPVQNSRTAIEVNKGKNTNFERQISTQSNKDKESNK